MPVDVDGEAIDVFLELPREAALSDPSLTDHRHQPGAGFLGTGVQLILEEAQLDLSAGERRFDAFGPASATKLADDPQGAVGDDRFVLALDLLLAHRSALDGGVDQVARRLADENGIRLGDRLQPGGDVDQVTDHQALLVATRPHRGLAAGHSDPQFQIWHREFLTEGRHHVDQVQRRPDRSFGIILVALDRAPHRHHRVADELVDGSSKALDDVARSIEVGGEQVAHLLRVTRLRERGKPH